jgi:hypothetical protein
MLLCVQKIVKSTKDSCGKSAPPTTYYNYVGGPGQHDQLRISVGRSGNSSMRKRSGSRSRRTSGSVRLRPQPVLDRADRGGQGAGPGAGYPVAKGVRRRPLSDGRVVAARQEGRGVLLRPVRLAGAGADHDPGHAARRVAGGCRRALDEWRGLVRTDDGRPRRSCTTSGRSSGPRKTTDSWRRSGSEPRTGPRVPKRPRSSCFAAESRATTAPLGVDYCGRRYGVPCDGSRVGPSRRCLVAQFLGVDEVGQGPPRRTSFS